MMFVWLHIILGFSALMLGLIVLLKEKGTRPHRLVGLLYVISIVIINMTALTITNKTDSYGVFHILAMVNLVTTVLGIVAIKMGSIQTHYHLMHWSYAGLLSATVNQLHYNKKCQC